ncbi:MAG: hypothetical protein MJA84_14350 [Firmicutes bacterium]|nr:hypothetical protein [Bacillota bacterium]
MSHARTIGLVAAVALVVGLLLSAADAGSEDDRVTQLERRVTELEKELTELRAQLEPVLEKAKLEKARDTWRAKARQRMQLDSEKHDAQTLQKVEKLYQSANKNLRGDDTRQILNKLIEQYPDCNRTGCAVLYLAQMSTGKEQEALLKRAVKDYGDCFYGDGVQVGPYATYYLAWYYHKNKQPEQASRMAEIIRTQYPTAITHKGEWLVDYLPQ